MIQLDYKTNRQRQEMESGSLNLRITFILKWAMSWIALVYPKYKRLVITDVYRNTDEQDEIYLNSPDPKVAAKYKKKPWLSVHQFWRGIDIRTNNMSSKMIRNLLAILNTIPYDPTRPRIKTAKYHDAGTGSHIHIQVRG